MRTIIDRSVYSCKNVQRTKLQWGLCTFKRAQTCLCSVYAAWGCSSVGRALPPQGRGRGFDSLHLHHSFSYFLPYFTGGNANIIIRKKILVMRLKRIQLSGISGQFKSKAYAKLLQILKKQNLTIAITKFHKILFNNEIQIEYFSCFQLRSIMYKYVKHVHTDFYAIY